MAVSTPHSLRACVLASLFLAAAFSPASFADTQIFTGTLDANSPTAPPLEGGRPECGNQLPYMVSGPVQASNSEAFAFFDADFIWGVQMCVGLYSGSFNPADVSQNRIAAVDGSFQANLQAGQDYVIVAQPLCFGDGSFQDQGPFGIGVTPVATASNASVTGGPLQPLPDFGEGTFAGTEPTMDLGEGPHVTDIIGPYQVPETGNYYFTDMRFVLSTDLLMGVYDAPPNTGNPQQNRLFIADDFSVLSLEAGKDYWFAVQPFFAADRGRWLFTLATQAEFFLNALLAGSWFNAAFPGQGFFLDVFPNFGQVFLAWFTFDTMGPADPNEANVGYSGSRWLTAFGPYSGASADLAIELTTGGRFVDPAMVEQDLDYGSINLEFTDCNAGTITYDIPSAGVDGEIPITRIATDNVPLCEDQVNQPGELLTQ